jgi:hypothetical protein
VSDRFRRNDLRRHLRFKAAKEREMTNTRYYKILLSNVFNQAMANLELMFAKIAKREPIDFELKTEEELLQKEILIRGEMAEMLKGVRK